MVWDASAGAVRASYWRTTVDEDGHYCFAAASDSPHRTTHEAQQCRRPQGLDATSCADVGTAALRPRSIHLVCEPAQFERLCRAGSVPTTGSCRTGQSLGSLARLERLLRDRAIWTTFWCVWLSPPAMESPPECEDGPRLKTRTTGPRHCAMQSKGKLFGD